MGAALPALGVPTGAAFYDAALEGHVRTNMEILRRDPDIPPIMVSGVKYSVNRSKQWKFANTIVDEGVGDCEGLSAWRVAELRVSGEDPDARVRTYRTGPTKFHAVVERCDGIVEDPSAIFGMPIRNPASYIGKLVDNFGEGAVQGDENDGFYNAAPPNEDADQQGSAIDDFFHTDPQQVDMGPGVGPADPEYYGEQSADDFYNQPPQDAPQQGGGGGGDSGGGGGGSPDPSQQRPQRPGQGQQGQQGQQQQRGQQQGQQGQQQQRGQQQGQQGQQRGQQQGGQGGGQSGMNRATSGNMRSGGGAQQQRSTSTTPKASAPKQKTSRPARGGKTHGVGGVIDVPFICLEGPDDDYDQQSYDPNEESGPDDAAGFRPYDPQDDSRDVSVDVQQTDDGGYVSTVRVPVAGGNTVVAQSSKAATAKKAAVKAFNIAKILGNNKTVQDALPPQARLTLAALKSDTAKQIFSQLKW